MEDLDALSKRWLQAERAAYAAEAHAQRLCGDPARHRIRRFVAEQYRAVARMRFGELVESVRGLQRNLPLL